MLQITKSVSCKSINKHKWKKKSLPNTGNSNGLKNMSVRPYLELSFCSPLRVPDKVSDQPQKCDKDGEHIRHMDEGHCRAQWRTRMGGGALFGFVDGHHVVERICFEGGMRSLCSQVVCWRSIRALRRCNPTAVTLWTFESSTKGVVTQCTVAPSTIRLLARPALQGKQNPDLVERSLFLLVGKLWHTGMTTAFY